MKIALLCLGTRGDVQPYAVLGRALQLRGHEVVLSSAKNFSDLVRPYGLPFVPVEVDYQGLLNTGEGKEMMKNPLKAGKYLRGLIYPMMIQSLSSFYEISREQDLTLFHAKTMAHQYAHCFPGKMMQANVVPAIEPTSEFVNPVFSTLGFPQFLNRLSYKLTQLGLRMWNKPVQVFRNRFGLQAPPSNFSIPSIYGISSHFLQRPFDYPDHCQFTGFWTAPSEESLDKDLLAFLNAGEPPLLITFGSMPFNSKLRLADAIPALSKACGIRIVVVRGWGLKNEDTPNEYDQVYYTDGAPYDLLMPRVRAVVHHGGIGTLAACLQAGKPSWICPVLYPLGDQHFWALQGMRKGVCLPPVPLKKLTQQSLTTHVKKLLEDDTLYAASTRMKDMLAMEDGIGNAIQLIEEWI